MAGVCPQASAAPNQQPTTVLGMPRLTIVTTRPIGARWQVEIPGRAPIETRTLKTAETIAVRRTGGPIDLQVSLGGLEDLCADAVELGEESDALAA